MTYQERLLKAKNIYLEKVNALDLRINKLKLLASETANTKTIYWVSLQKKIKQAYDDMKKLSNTFAEYSIPIAYNGKAKTEIDRIKSLKTLPKSLREKKINLNARYHINTINTLIEDTETIIATSIDDGNKMISSLLRRTQQQLISEERLNIAIAKGLEETGTVKAVKTKILESLQGELKNDFTIKAGSKRFKAKYYAELVARTKIREAQSYGVMNIAIDYDTDLVEVDSHNTTTPICIPFEGKIFSISGKDKDFPALSDTPPFHPNCLHNITVIFREVLERRGIQKYIDFANGKTEIHPTRQSHIPISKRKIA